MGSWHIFVGLSSFMVLVVSDSQICPVLEGREITLTCTVLYKGSRFRTRFYWDKKVNGAVSAVAVCHLDKGRHLDEGRCILSPSTLRYTVTVTNINASSATSNITIPSTARTDQGSWFCAGSSLTQDVTVCDLKVFATPTSVSCSQPELQYDNVLVTCTGDRVYPQPLCQFTWLKNGIELSTNNVTVKNQTLSQSQNTDYFYLECTWTIPVQALNFGSHQFYALIYPNVTGNTTTDMSYGRNSSLTSPVEINQPEVVLESCPQDYIKEGTTASCTCREKHNLFLKANVSWSCSQGGSVVGKQTSTLNFTAQRNGPNYTCRAEVLHIWSENKTFVPEVALTETAEASNNTDLVPVVGAPAGIIFISLVATAVYIAWRKGILNRFTRKENRPVLRYMVGAYEDKDLPITQYEHSLFDIGSIKPGQMADPGNVKTVEPSSPYACIDDNPSDTVDVAYMNYVPNRDAQTCSPYEEIRTVPANSSSSVTTDMREDLPYST